MDLIRSLFGHRGTAEPSEPKLSPETQERYQKLSPAKRRRLIRTAEEEAAASLRVDPSRDFAANRDAWIELELSGINEQMTAVIKDKFQNPGDRSNHWSVVVGQDDPPDGLWGWMIMDPRGGPRDVIARVPVAFATRDEARQAGEAAADALWIKINRQLAGG